MSVRVSRHFRHGCVTPLARPAAGVHDGPVSPDEPRGQRVRLEPGRRGVAAVWPFGSPFSLAVGTLSLDLLAAVVITSLGRRHLPFRAWRTIHWSAYAAWPLAFAHTIAMGTDAHLWWLELPVLSCAAAMGALVSWRVLRPAV